MILAIFMLLLFGWVAYELIAAPEIPPNDE